jgi:hypothetical protein
MNKVKAYCDAAWSGVSMAVTIGLLATAAYWLVLQRPPLTYNVEGLKTTYNVTHGAAAYLENPIYPPDTTLRVMISSSLVSQEGKGDYRLASVDSREGFKPDKSEERLSFVRPGYPVYSVFIPSYVKPGVYTYRAEATYRLNLFRTASIGLPDLTLVVE